MAMNLVVLTGRLTRDPELKYAASGKAYCKFSLAVDRAFQKDQADFINCTAFGKTAELIGEYLRKGRLCGVQGRIQTDTYESNGEKRYSTSVMVDRIEFLESRNSADSSQDNFGGVRQESPSYKQAEKPVAAEPDIDFDEDDEFPF
jgi:single-strand DNA-binding protein